MKDNKNSESSQVILPGKLANKREKRHGFEWLSFFPNYKYGREVKKTKLLRKLKFERNFFLMIFGGNKRLLTTSNTLNGHEKKLVTLKAHFIF